MYIEMLASVLVGAMVGAIVGGRIGAQAARARYCETLHLYSDELNEVKSELAAAEKQILFEKQVYEKLEQRLSKQICELIDDLDVKPTPAQSPPPQLALVTPSHTPSREDWYTDPSGILISERI